MSNLWEQIISTSPIHPEKKKRKAGQSWKEDEDTRLLTAVQIYGTSRWVEISKYVGTRSRKQCRERYVNHVCPSIDNREWTNEEDELIMKYHNQFNNKWCFIAKQLKGRTARAIRNRYYSLMNKPKTCFVPSKMNYRIIIGGKIY